MKSNKRILRYISGLMSPLEMKSFEDELSTSESLNSEYHSIKARIQKIIPDIREEESGSYFITMVPKVRARLENKKIAHLRYVKYLAPALIISLLYLIIPFRSPSLIEEQIRDLNDSSRTELLNLIEQSVPVSGNNELIETAITTQITADDINQVNSEYLNTYELLENLSEEEVNDIYNMLLNKEIL